MAHIKTLTDPECNILLAYLNSHTNRLDPVYRRHRTYLLFLLLLDAGLRVAELVNLRWRDLVVNRKVTDVLSLPGSITKTHIPRAIPISLRLHAAISLFYSNVLSYSDFSSDSYVFRRANMRPHLTTRQLRRIVNNVTTACLNRSASPHTLRHTFATRVLRSSSTRVVQELLGHKRLSSTQIYTHPNSTDLRDAIDKM